MCGCGERTNLCASSAARRGDVKGQPKRYMVGHVTRKSPVEYLVDEATGCWIWQRAITSAGYGQLTIGRRSIGAHRVYYERLVGPIPDGMQLDHLCRNRACVNPAHLEAVTSAENTHRGSRVKLTPELSAEIRLLASSGATQRALARRFGVSPMTVWKVCTGRSWKPEVAL
jgi:predicted DNA-binding protein (UPF0251 family)